MQSWVAPMKAPEPPVLSPVRLATIATNESENQAGVNEKEQRGGSYAAADLVWHSVVHSQVMRAAAAPDQAPVIPYNDLAAIALARVDSRAIFP